MSHSQTRKTQQAGSLVEAVQEGAQGIAEAGANVYNAAVEHTQETAKQVQTYVRKNPWYAIGIAAGAGFLVGYMCGRRS